MCIPKTEKLEIFANYNSKVYVKLSKTTTETN